MLYVKKLTVTACCTLYYFLHRSYKKKITKRKFTPYKYFSIKSVLFSSSSFTASASAEKVPESFSQQFETFSGIFQAKG